MTIENNKKYKLTGEQIKDIAFRFGVLSGEIGDLTNLTTTDKTNLVAAINEAAAGSGGSATIFYLPGGIPGMSEDMEGPLFYKDSSYQTPATSSEIYAACMAGTTYICSNQSDDLFYTEIVAASNYGTNYNFSLANIEHGLGYDCTISSYIRSGTEYYSFHYNEPSSINVVQATGNSTTDVMSQNAATRMVYRDSTKHFVDIGFRNATQSFAGGDGVAIGRIDTGWTVADHGVILSSEGAYVSGRGGVAIGAGAIATQQGEMNIGSRYPSFGYNNSNYRLLTGVYDPQSAHDAATKGYVDGLVGNIAAALNAINNGGGN